MSTTWLRSFHNALGGLLLYGLSALCIVANPTAANDSCNRLLLSGGSSVDRYQVYLEREARLPGIDVEVLARQGTFGQYKGKKAGGFMLKKHDRSGYSLFEFQFGDPDLSQRASLLYLHYLERYGFSQISPESAGVLMQISFRKNPKVYTYLTFDFGRMHLATVKYPHFHPGLSGLAESYRQFITESYRARRGLSDEVLLKLRKISEAVESRTILVARISEPIVTYNKLGGALYRDSFLETDLPQLKRTASQYGFRKSVTPFPNHPAIEGGASIVYSDKAGQLLPLELLTPFRIPRKQGERIAEVGRFSIAESSVQETSPKIVQQVAAIAKGLGVSKLVIEADVARARRFRHLGFKEIPGLTQINHSGVQEFVLEAGVDEILSRAIARGFSGMELDKTAHE